jgi:hypothetical protein
MAKLKSKNQKKGLTLAGVQTFFYKRIVKLKRHQSFGLKIQKDKQQGIKKLLRL